ncbi:type II toxin-antitoxin system PemK/MazF family toxin [Kitasatospora herbaricolor]|uniref:Type II toxin-antitoxin system PemK/MazF family toxin n=1 Tax=Kitasatospora herbaricolor TaxID=68217 RepID=A0ABZ1WL78_9ACTN|nr:type II toxin-antitoxin system PemK/MazF family toxin [Kitasatospora herbaricolor]
MGVNAYWVVGAAAVALAVLVGVLARRSRRGPGPGRPPRGGPGGRPAPREIWWAEVPFEDGPGAKDRPCLVLRVNRRTATVAKITSKHHAERPGVLALPPGAVGDAQGRTSWLETDELREVPLAAFRRRIGPLDERTWARARRGA